MSLSLCMIVKNEEKKIERAVKSAQGLVNETIIVDTGSTDGTKDKARALGAQVYNYKWNHDFSSARNFSISKAEMDWILVLDADEYLESPEKVIQDAIQDESVDAYSLKWNNLPALNTFLPGRKTRLFRRTSWIRFRGKVHEDVVEAVPKGRWKPLEAEIAHEVGETDPQKVEYYIKLSLEDIQEDPENPRAHFLIAGNYLQKNFLTHAKYHFMRSVQLSRRPFFSLIAAFYLLRLSLVNPAESVYFLNKCEELIGQYPDDPEIGLYPQIPKCLRELKGKLDNFSVANQDLQKFLNSNPW